MSGQLDTKLFECRTTARFGVICAKSEPAFKIVEKKKPVPTAKNTESKAPKVEEKEKPDDEDEDFDPFASDDSDDEEAVAEMEARFARIAKEKEDRRKAAGKTRGRDKTSFIFDIKPYDTETDLEAMAKFMKEKATCPGLVNYGEEHKLVPIAFGVKKLRIQMIVYDDECCQDDLEDMFMKHFEDDIQSIDCFSVSKV